MQNVIIINPNRLEKIKEKIRRDGFEKLQVVADFDKTLNSCFVNGKKIASLISILRDEHYLTPDYSEKAQALYDKYHPLEADPNIPLQEKKKLMHEWWTTHYDLLIKSRLRKNDLAKAIQSENLALRPGAEEFFDFLHSREIPLLIFSAAGLGAETIALYLEKSGKLYENIHIISNAFVFDKDGLVVGVKEPIVHTFNKDYAIVKQYPVFEKLKERKNIILLGDSAGDADMTAGFEHSAIIKIGFLNEHAEDSRILQSFKEIFDVVILNDGPMDCVNELIKSLMLNNSTLL